MSSVVISGDSSGTVTLTVPAVAGTNTITLPASTGTVLTTGSPQSGGVIQMVTAVKTDTFSSTSVNTFVDVTGLSATITPKFSTSKILVMISLGGLGYSAANMFVAGNVLRNGTLIVQGDSAGSATRVSFTTQSTGTSVADGNWCLSSSWHYVDSPASTSALTYKLQMTNVNAAGTWYVNRTGNTVASYDQSTSSSITLMEIAA